MIPTDNPMNEFNKKAYVFNPETDTDKVKQDKEKQDKESFYIAKCEGANKKYISDFIQLNFVKYTLLADADKAEKKDNELIEQQREQKLLYKKDGVKVEANNLENLKYRKDFLDFMDISRDQIFNKDGTRITKSKDKKIDAFIRAKTKQPITNLIKTKFNEKINQPKWWDALNILGEDLNKDDIGDIFIEKGIFKTAYIKNSTESGVTFEKPTQQNLECKENDYIIIEDEEKAKEKEEAKATVKPETAEERLQKAMMY